MQRLLTGTGVPYNNNNTHQRNLNATYAEVASKHIEQKISERLKVSDATIAEVARKHVDQKFSDILAKVAESSTKYEELSTKVGAEITKSTADLLVKVQGEIHKQLEKAEDTQVNLNYITYQKIIGFTMRMVLAFCQEWDPHREKQLRDNDFNRSMDWLVKSASDAGMPYRTKDKVMEIYRNPNKFVAL